MAYNTELATQDDNTLLWPSPGDMPVAQALELSKAMGTDWIRLNIFSSYLHRYGWQPYDDAINAIVAKGMKVQLTIAGQPRWDVANPDGGLPFEDPTPAQFAAFAGYVVKHTKDRVRRFSLWNEPNHPAFLKSSGNTADLYALLYKAGYDAVRFVDNDCQILFAELLGGVGSQAWLNRVVSGRKLKASGFAVHPYQYETNPSKPKEGDNYQWGHLPLLKTHLDEFAQKGELLTRDGKALPIYVTEFGYFCEGEKRGIPESRRAAYVKTTIKQAREWGIRQYLYYHLVEIPQATWNSGIVKSDGTTTPTYRAIKSAFA